MGVDQTDKVGPLTISTRSWLAIWARWTVWMATVYALFYSVALVAQYDWELGWLMVGLPIGIVAGPFYAAAVTTPVTLCCRVLFHRSEPGRILGERIPWLWGVGAGAFVGIALGVLFSVLFNPPPHYNGGNWL